jgi:hypothetical protein
MFRLRLGRRGIRRGEGEKGEREKGKGEKTFTSVILNS